MLLSPSKGKSSGTACCFWTPALSFKFTNDFICCPDVYLFIYLSVFSQIHGSFLDNLSRPSSPSSLFQNGSVTPAVNNLPD